MIDLRYVKKLIEIIDESTVDSIEITSDKGMKIRISKSPQQRGAVQMAAPIPIPAIIPGSAAPRISPPQGTQMIVEGEAPAPPPEPAKATTVDVKSPMVGTFYKSPEPSAKAYVAVGDRVSKGQIVCIIEAMKIMNEIESDHSGVIREILAQDAQPVEYGQVLFKIDPNG
jgi:acetyl-CoA carboxylase biotin carboxyl carrier protein